MKKTTVFLMVVCMALVSVAVQAQDQAKLFAGKWELATSGSPNGDSVMQLVIDLKDGKLSGVLTAHDQPIKINQIDLKDKTISFGFDAGAMEVYLDLTLKDDDTLSGNALGMVDIKGTRVK